MREMTRAERREARDRPRVTVRDRGDVVARGAVVSSATGTGSGVMADRGGISYGDDLTDRGVRTVGSVPTNRGDMSVASITTVEAT
jgi:hypothetical protein